MSFPPFWLYRHRNGINFYVTCNGEQIISSYIRSNGEYVAISCDKQPWFCVSVKQASKISCGNFLLLRKMFQNASCLSLYTSVEISMCRPNLITLLQPPVVLFTWHTWHITFKFNILRLNDREACHFNYKTFVTIGKCNMTTKMSFSGNFVQFALLNLSFR